ncbi:hypothetical protein [Runella limosa]|uniref:hypothetical protein n=1 Tax=Runella limosa TaxID=370978 RepID=UPI0004265D34|nr:hypothetical protein [Runella limosa]
MANVIPPTKGTIVKVTQAGAQFFWGASKDSTQQNKIDAKREGKHVEWQVGDALKSTGKTVENEAGLWLELETFRWYRRNVFKAWTPIPVLVYYLITDNTCTWVYGGIEGGKPTTQTGTVNTGTGAPQTPDKKSDTDTTGGANTLALVSIGIGILSLLKSK